MRGLDFILRVLYRRHKYLKVEPGFHENLYFNRERLGGFSLDDLPYEASERWFQSMIHRTRERYYKEHAWNWTERTGLPITEMDMMRHRIDRLYRRRGRGPSK